MKIVYNTWFPFGNYHTLNFFGILFTKRKQLYNEYKGTKNKIFRKI